jgi:hypothetical protein
MTHSLLVTSDARGQIDTEHREEVYRMTLNIIDASKMGNLEQDNCTPIVNAAMAQGGKVWADSGNIVPTKILLPARYARFDARPDPIPDGVMFEYLPARMTCLIKNFDAGPSEPFWLKQYNLCDFGNCHIFNNRIGGLAFKDLTGFSRSQGVSISMFGTAYWDDGAVFDGSALVAYGDRNMNLDHLRIAGCRGVSLRFRCAKAIHGNINVIGGWKTDPRGPDVVFEGPDLTTPSDTVALSGTFGNVQFRNAVGIVLTGGVASVQCDEGYSILIMSDVCEDPYNGVSTVVNSWKPTVKIHRPNFDYPAITMAKPTGVRRGEAEAGPPIRPIGKVPKSVQKIMNKSAHKPKGEDYPHLAKAFRKQHRKFI